jgi:serine/threonine-protein kinase
VIKRPPAGLRDQSEYLARFRRASHLSRRLTHDGLVAVQDVGEVEGEPYIAEEFVEGHDLADVMRRCLVDSRRIPTIAALHIVCETARALGFLHEFEGLSLVYRKLRPSKIRITYSGGVKLLDLASGRTAGTEQVLRPASLAEEWPYWAPEQLADGPIDRRADIYALGVVFWECLAGCSFFSAFAGGQAGLAGATREQVMEKIRAHQPPPPSRFNPDVRVELDTLVMRALAKSPEERLLSTGEIERVLAPMTGDPGRAAVARLMSRLFDVHRERDDRAELLAGVTGPEPMDELSGSSLVDMPESIQPGPSAEGSASDPGPSMTTIVSHNTLWLRRFAIVFGAALVAAIAFNIYMTKRLDGEAAAASRPALSLPALEKAVPPPPAAPVPLAVPAAANNPPAVAEVPRPATAVSRPASPPPAVAPPVPAPVPAGDKARPHVSNGEGKKALEQARSAFERDDFPKAVQLGRAALAQGEGGAHAILGAAYFKLGRFEEAEREYGEALRLDPKNPALIKRVDLAHRAASRGAEGTAP